jgi:hypothetical protein
LVSTVINLWPGPSLVRQPRILSLIWRLTYEPRINPMRVNFESCGIFSSLVSYRKLICLARLCSPGSEHTCVDQFCSAASAMPCLGSLENTGWVMPLLVGSPESGIQLRADKDHKREHNWSLSHRCFCNREHTRGGAPAI